MTTHAERPLVTRSRAELECAVIEAARALVAMLDPYHVLLRRAIADLDEWERLRAEA